MISANIQRFYINGEWVAPLGKDLLGVENPATEEALGEIAMGSAADADRAVAAARAAFAAFSATPADERIALLERILAEYDARAEDFAQAMRLEMGAPITWAREAQVLAGQVHLQSTIAAAKAFVWEESRGATRIVREGIGVCALITPWNWPLNQIVCKVAPAIAAGCTIVLKPSEIAPLSGLLWAEVCHAAGVPAGVFNLVNGTGPLVGAHLSQHSEVDMVSFTGSTRAGVQVALNAAPTVKRVAQELGGKSANIILPSADIAAAVAQGVEAVMANTGQSCDAPTRMFIPRGAEAQAFAAARSAVAEIVIGDTSDAAVTMGPLVSRAQYDKVQGLIGQGIAEGAMLVCGGLGRPAGMNCGHYVQPTIFGHVTPGMAVEREEIFGPVLVILSYDNVDHALAMANDTIYGLAAYVQGDLAQARLVARQLRAGQVNINGPEWDTFAPFGGYKQSGNGREYAGWGIHDFCEVKAMVGYEG
jgi:aldehyde dehydrogenase (NAD+)